MDTQTRQLAAVCPQAKGTTLAHLVAYLHARGDDMPLDQALGLAIDAWLATDQLRLAGVAVKGYQWKCLFLPDGTHVRMRCKGMTEYAVVAGDTLLYQGRSVSPRGMTLAIAGEGRNAWSALMVRRPGDENWQYASVLRARIERTARQAQAQVQPPVQAQLQAQPQPLPQPQPQAITHADSLATAARCMSDALRSAMAVVSHMNAQAAQQQDERRRGRCRRESDRHPDDVAFE